MLTPLPLGLGLRYVQARQHQYFVSFISWVSLAGIALGVAALIAILSVMNGFEGELRTRLLALSAHATLPAGPESVGFEASRNARGGSPASSTPSLSSKSRVSCQMDRRSPASSFEASTPAISAPVRRCTTP